MLTCNTILVKIWLFMLFSGFVLLLLCITMGSIPGYNKNILLYVGVTGGGLIIIGLLIARYYNPLKILLCNEEDETINHNILVLDNEIQRNNIKHMNPVVTVEVYEETSEYRNLSPEIVTIAVPINNV